MSKEFPNPLTEVNAWSKIKILNAQAHNLLTRPTLFKVPNKPGRDVTVLDIKKHPPKLGLSHKEGQARLLHDLASIELQAMELGIRSLIEYPQANSDFREQLLKVNMEESKHLLLCLEGLRSLGYEFGHFPVHTVLWDCVCDQDSLLDRILIVHRYLEGSGLDASHLILRRLSGVEDKRIEKVVKVIATEEIGHVQFGTDWFRNFSKLEGLDPNEQFVLRLKSLRSRLPRRLDPITEELRRSAGFNDVELTALAELKEHFLKGVKPPQSSGASTSPRAKVQAL